MIESMFLHIKTITSKIFEGWHGPSTVLGLVPTWVQGTDSHGSLYSGSTFTLSSSPWQPEEGI